MSTSWTYWYKRKEMLDHGEWDGYVRSFEGPTGAILKRADGWGGLNESGLPPDSRLLN